MKAFKTGDRVSVIHDVISGVVLTSDTKQTEIQDQDGFVRKYRTNELVLAHDEIHYKIADSLLLKESATSPIKKKSGTKSTSQVTESFEIDLHFEALLNDHTLIDTHQILQKQLTACKDFIQKSMRKKLKRIVLIHGKGEGILKAEIHLYLNRLKSDFAIKLSYGDAPYYEYGVGGATEVIFYEVPGS